ncbi:hypothetical protein B7939_02230 [Eggerthia catenaformis]|nr:hypothetical protein B7939_02230 [Eggerthia catenaformis]
MSTKKLEIIKVDFKTIENFKILIEDVFFKKYENKAIEMPYIIPLKPFDAYQEPKNIRKELDELIKGLEEDSYILSYEKEKRIMDKKLYVSDQAIELKGKEFFKNMKISDYEYPILDGDLIDGLIVSYDNMDNIYLSVNDSDESYTDSDDLFNE